MSQVEIRDASSFPGLISFDVVIIDNHSNQTGYRENISCQLLSKSGDDVH